MRFLGRALAALFAVGVFLVAIAWFLPREVTVTREIVIAAPAGPDIRAPQLDAEDGGMVALDPPRPGDAHELRRTARGNGSG